MRALLFIALSAGLSACAYAPTGQGYPAYVPTPGQGQYVYPERLRPAPLPYQPAADTCGAQRLASLVGQHESTLYIPALPGTKRILRPAFNEGFDNDFLGGELTRPPFVEVQDYRPGQAAYSRGIDIRDVRDLGPVDDRRLTLEIASDGYIQDIRCG